MVGAVTSAATRPNNTEADWWQHAVLYQIYPRSFMDSNNDGIGDLRGIISKLPYLAEIGITGTWLSPIFKSPMVDFGYDIADFKSIQAEYGTMKDFDDLIAEAKRFNIKIILDFVPNHSSDQCEWFKKSVNREEGFEDFYVWVDGKVDKDGKRQPPNNWNSVFYGSAWEWNEKRQQYYLHQFTVGQPDLNYRNPKVVQAMDDVLRFWLDKGVSGFRVDAVNHLFEKADFPDEPLSGKVVDNKSYDYTNHIYSIDLPEVLDMLQHWRELLDDYSATHDGPTRIMMTEAYTNIKLLMDYYETRDGKRGPHFPFNFDFITDLNNGSDARDFVSVIQKWLTYMPRGHVANWVMGNHDNPRVASRYSPDLVDVLNMMMMSLPGVAVTYNGEEIGMVDYRDMSWDDTVDPAARNVGPDKYKWVSRDPERTPFQWSAEKNAGFSTAAKTWLPVHPDYATNNLELQRAAPRSTFKVYKALTELRKSAVMRDGLFRLKVVNRDVCAIKRELKGQATVYTILNLAATEQHVNLGEVFTLPKTQLTVLVAASKSAHDKGDKLRADSLTLAPHEGLVCMLEV